MDQSKKILAVILAAIILAATAVALGEILGNNNSAGTGNKAAQTEKTYVASGHPEWPPIMWRSEDAIIGAGPALLQLIGKDLGINIESKYAGLWDEVQAKARSGEVDMIAAAYKTKEREKYMEYSIPYTVDPVALFVRKGAKIKFEKREDLKKLRGVDMVGDSYGQEFDDYIKSDLRMTTVDSTDKAFEMLKLGKADYFVYALYSGEKFLNQKEDLNGEFEALPKFVTQENFYITVSKKSELVKYLPEINGLIDKYKNDGTIDKLIEENRKAVDKKSTTLFEVTDPQ